MAKHVKALRLFKAPSGNPHGDPVLEMASMSLPLAQLLVHPTVDKGVTEPGEAAAARKIEWTLGVFALTKGSAETLLGRMASLLLLMPVLPFPVQKQHCYSFIPRKEFQQ